MKSLLLSLKESFAALAILILVIKRFLPDAAVNTSRQASNKEVKRGSSSVATQSEKRRKGKFNFKSYNAIGWKFSAFSKLSTIFFFAIKEQLHETCI